MPVLQVHLVNGLQKGDLGKIVCDSSAEGELPKVWPLDIPARPWPVKGQGWLSLSAGFLGFLARFSQVTSLRSDWMTCFEREPSSLGAWGLGLMSICTGKVVCIKFFTTWPYCPLWGSFDWESLTTDPICSQSTKSATRSKWILRVDSRSHLHPTLPKASLMRSPLPSSPPTTVDYRTIVNQVSLSLSLFFLPLTYLSLWNLMTVFNISQ